ncbi:MAG: transglutaminase-like domain-containing protein, partial [Flavobacteriales bacterium]|nr:transglutaminase-like domain-containing protein [Flavobacteriales bacterium]
DHEYTEQDWIFTGGAARRDGNSLQDDFPNAYGTYSWRLGEDNVSWTGTFTNSGTINAFGFKVRRWDASPTPNYEVAYSTNGGMNFTLVETIDNAYLDNSSQWKVFEHELGTPVSIGANDFVVRLSQTSGERIFIDDFSFDLTADDCDNETWYYRSVTSGSYTNKLTWEKSSTGASWEPADCPPNENASEVLIRDGHNVFVNTGIAIPTLIIEGNALLRIDAGTVDMSVGSITINANGVLEFDGGEVPVFPSSGIGITVDGTLRVSTAVGGISSALAGNGSSGKVSYADGSVFEWNTSGAAAFQSSGQTYFPDVDASTIPIFSIPQAMGVAGASSNSFINGVFQVDGSMTWDNSGEKIIRNGITGNGTITQSASSGLIRLTASNVELGGTGALALNSNGLLIPSGVTVDLQSDKPVVNASEESGRIEIEGVLNDNGFGIPGDVDNVVIGSTGLINCTNPNGLIAPNGTFGSTAGAYSFDANSLIDYQRTGDQDVTTVSNYGNLTIRGSGTKTITNGVTSVLGDLLVDGSAVISAAPEAGLSFTNDMTISGTASFDSGAHDNLVLSTSGENIQNINGNANPIRCLSFLSVKANSSLTLNGVSAVEVKGEWETDYYSTGNFTNGGATLQVGGDMRIRGGDFDRYSIAGTVRLTGESGAAQQVFRGTDDSPVSAV